MSRRSVLADVAYSLDPAYTWAQRRRALQNALTADARLTLDLLLLVGIEPSEDLLGTALHDAAAGETVEVLLGTPPPASPPPAPTRNTMGIRPSLRPGDLIETPLVTWQAGPVQPEQPDGPNPNRPIGEVAADLERQRRARLDAELAQTFAPPEAPSDDDHDFPAEQFEQNGVQVLPPEAVRLLANLRSERAQEAAVDAADPARPSTMGPAAHAAQRMEEGAGTVPAPGTSTPCGYMTMAGPCSLRAGHPTGDDLPGQNGHLWKE